MNADARICSESISDLISNTRATKVNQLNQTDKTKAMRGRLTKSHVFLNRVTKHHTKSYSLSNWFVRYLNLNTRFLLSLRITGRDQIVRIFPEKYCHSLVLQEVWMHNHLLEQRYQQSVELQSYLPTAILALIVDWAREDDEKPASVLAPYAKSRLKFKFKFKVE
jgi:hypothetical protein